MILPDMTGPALAERLRKHWPVERHGGVPPLSRFLQKPFVISDLAMTVRAVLDRTG